MNENKQFVFDLLQIALEYIMLYGKNQVELVVSLGGFFRETNICTKELSGPIESCERIGFAELRNSFPRCFRRG